MIGTYAAVVAICGAALLIGQASIALCGARQWSWLSGAVGLALLGAACWGTVRLGGNGKLSAAVVVALAIAAALFLRGRVEGVGRALRSGLPVGLLALAAASLPFAVEGHFGILGTGLNPDMSQHLLAADRLAHGADSPLLQQGYPLGPHSIVVALDKGLGIGLVQGFGGLTLAVAVLASLTALSAFGRLPPLQRAVAALLVGLPYMVASYLAQGAFKETMQALFVLAFALSLHESSRGWRDLQLRFVPAAAIAVGTVYTYSFPGLAWLLGTAVIWALVETVQGRGAGASPARGAAPSPSPVRGTAASPSPVRGALLALLTFAVLTAPELGRMIDFRRFETFAPHGPGLGNLFGQISPFEALGIWPSGDFRLAPGAGVAPAAAFYLGMAFATALLLYGLVRSLRLRHTAILAALLSAIAAYVAARIGGTPYTAAKAIEVAAPLCTFVILAPLLGRTPPDWRFTRVYDEESASRGEARAAVAAGAGGTLEARGHAGARGATGALMALYALAAAGCSLLALANAPVGPTSYSPALTEMRSLLSRGSTLVLASPQLLQTEHGADYIEWELRGGRVCVGAEGSLGALPGGIRFVVTEGRAAQPPFRGLHGSRRAGPYVLWERAGPVRGHSPCPLIAVRQARQGEKG